MRNLLLMTLVVLGAGFCFSQEIDAKTACIEEYDSSGVLIYSNCKDGDWTIFVDESMSWIGNRDNNDTTYTTNVIFYEYTFEGEEGEQIYYDDEDGSTSFFTDKVLVEFSDPETKIKTIITYSK